MKKYVDNSTRGIVMKITVENDFHHTRAELVPTETYELESGGSCAVIPYKEYLRAERVLCGIKQCSCLKVPGNGLGDDGVRYALKFGE